MRVVETRLVEGPVCLARLAGAADGDLLPRKIRDHNPVVCAVGDEQTPADCVRQDFAGEEERAIATFSEAGLVEA